jgi:hypothetical protein
LVSDPDLNGDFNQIIDATAETALEMSADEARILAGRVLFSPTSRRAFAATDPAIFGMGRLMGTYHDIPAQPEEGVLV